MGRQQAESRRVTSKVAQKCCKSKKSVFWHPQRHASSRNIKTFVLPHKTGHLRVDSSHIWTQLGGGLSPIVEMVMGETQSHVSPWVRHGPVSWTACASARSPPPQDRFLKCTKTEEFASLNGKKGAEAGFRSRVGGRAYVKCTGWSGVGCEWAEMAEIQKKQNPTPVDRSVFRFFLFSVYKAVN